MRIKLLDQLREATPPSASCRRRSAPPSRTSPSTSASCDGAGMVARTKDGNHARYSISDDGVFELCDQVCGGVRRQLQELEAILQPT